MGQGQGGLNQGNGKEGHVIGSLQSGEVCGLVERAQAGDRFAYGALVTRFEPTVFAIAMARLRNPAEAQELCQEVFIHTMTRLAQLRDTRCFAGWLRQITVRMAINRLSRRAPLTTGKPAMLDGARAPGQGPLEEMVRIEECARLRRGLTRLKALDRQTLEAFYIRGRSLKQMSREFETPVGTIKRRLHVARKRLKRQLAPAQ
jgi:RNA polymerase sigma-70 factor (ECF subfamily)